MSSKHVATSMMLKKQPDQLFRDDVTEDNTGILELPISSLHPFKGHPFRVIDDEDMDKLVESIKDHGIEDPLVVRKDGTGYEIISGHRRKRACEIAGIDKVPVIIKDYDDDAAIIAMVDANMTTRQSILPSEKAYAFRMEVEARHRKSSRGTSNTRQDLSNETGESERNITRYIRLTYLIPELLEKVDKGSITFIAAVETAYLNEDNQRILLDILNHNALSYSVGNALTIKELQKDKEHLTESDIAEVLIHKKAEKRVIKLTSKQLNEVFPKTLSMDVINKEFDNFLDAMKKKYTD